MFVRWEHRRKKFSGERGDGGCLRREDRASEAGSPNSPLSGPQMYTHVTQKRAGRVSGGFGQKAEVDINPEILRQWETRASGMATADSGRFGAAGV